MHRNQNKHTEYLAKYGSASKWIATNLIKFIQRVNPLTPRVH